jgi:hypothetical protein
MSLNETYSTDRIGKEMLYHHCFSTLPWNMLEKQEGLILNGTHQLLAYADDVNILAENVDTIQKNTKPY